MNILSSLLNFIGSRIQNDGGREADITVPANSYVDVPVTFNRTFTTAPNVVVSFESASTAGAMGGLSCGAINITQTGFTIRAFNNTSSQRAPAVQWIAVVGG